MVTIHNPIPEAAAEDELEIHPGKVEHPQPRRKPECPVDCDDDKDSSKCCDKCADADAWYEAIEFNKDLQDDAATIRVRNDKDRPIQVGSHYNLTEVNSGLMALKWDSQNKKFVVDTELKKHPEAQGRRLNIAAGTSVRFEPGDECCVELVEIEGLSKGALR
ncbi:urease subunit beta [Saccharopolyspora pogona]|uniref:urease subunit beta n=1 Tax=Saccharopolyspora pogona TaxID=333966 RepID=UPI0021DF7A8B|nr:urease subunit beta [Saccharopolyspora pogona]